VGQAASPKYTLLKSTVQAHLGSLPVQVVTREVEHLPDVQVAGLTNEEGDYPLLAAWLSADDAFLLTLVPPLDRAPRVRRLRDGDVTWLARCDAIAVMLRSELEPLLAESGFVAPEPEEPVEPPAPLPRAPDVELALSFGYAPAVLSVEGPYLHGMSASLGVLFVGHLAFSVALGLGQGAHLDPLGDRARLGRWPLRVGIGAQAALGPVDLLGDLGLVLDIWRLMDLAYVPMDAAALGTGIDVAFSPAVTARFRILPWLAPYLTAGVDLYPRSRLFLLQQEALLQRDAVVPRIGAGIAILLRPRW